MIASSRPAHLAGSRSKADLEHLVAEDRRRGPPGARVLPASYQPHGWDMLGSCSRVLLECSSSAPRVLLVCSSIIPLSLAVFTPAALLRPRQASSKPSELDFGGLVTQPPASVAIQRRPARRAE